MKIYIYSYPIPAIILSIGRSAEILISILWRDNQQFSYKRHDYESVDEKSLSKAMSQKTMKKKKEFGR